MIFVVVELIHHEYFIPMFGDRAIILPVSNTKVQAGIDHMLVAKSFWISANRKTVWRCCDFNYEIVKLKEVLYSIGSVRSLYQVIVGGYDTNKGEYKTTLTGSGWMFIDMMGHGKENWSYEGGIQYNIMKYINHGMIHDRKCAKNKCGNKWWKRWCPIYLRIRL